MYRYVGHKTATLEPERRLQVSDCESAIRLGIGTIRAAWQPPSRDVTSRLNQAADRCAALEAILF